MKKRDSMQRAQRRLATAEEKLEQNALDAGILDLYYAVYFAGRHLLVSRGHEAPSHHILFETLEENCVGPGLLGPQFFSNLKRVESLFEASEQGVAEAIEDEVMTKAVESVRRFLQYAEVLAKEDLHGT
jgi:uncharacterized protein (UPF0332 family)